LFIQQSAKLKVVFTTSMFAINVSILNGTVARLEQCRNYESRESDQQTQALTEKQTIIYTKA